jgi:hypothetical protein
MNEVSRFSFGAHHPHCNFHHHHIVRPFGKPLCLGCFCMWTGVGLGLVALMLNMKYFHIPPYLMMVVGLLNAPFPFVQIKIQNRLYKIVARMALGFGSTLLLATAVIMLPLDSEGVILRILVVGAYILLARIALRLRNENKDDPCYGCPEGAFPLCSWKHPEISRALDEYDLDEDSREFLELVVASFDKTDETPIRMFTAEEILSSE